MTKRLSGLLVGMTAVASFALPAAPAQATCIGLLTTPVECIKEAVGATGGCVYYGTFELVCLPSST